MAEGPVTRGCLVNLMPELALGFIFSTFRTLTGLESDRVGLMVGADWVAVRFGQRMDHWWQENDFGHSRANLSYEF